MKNRMPENWTAPYPGIVAEFGDQVSEVTIAYYGVQSSKVALTRNHEFIEWFESLLQDDYAPKAVERAKFADNQGHENIFFIAYWSDNDAFGKWESTENYRKFWHAEERLHSDFGVWKEVLRIPVSRFETLFSATDKAGAAQMCPHFSSPINEHAYWGSMRDRFDISKSSPLSSEEKGLSSPALHDSLHHRIVVSPPENLTLIRSAQDYTDSESEEREYYQKHLVPVLQAGMDYIGKNPLDSGCCMNRFSVELDENWEEQKKTFGAAYFLSLSHLENWAEHHPSHLAIFGNFHKMAQHFNFQFNLKLWHEVSVLPENDQLFEYVNCHPMTGLMPWFPGKAIA